MSARQATGAVAAPTAVGSSAPRASGTPGDAGAQPDVASAASPTASAAALPPPETDHLARVRPALPDGPTAIRDVSDAARPAGPPARTAPATTAPAPTAPAPTAPASAVAAAPSDIASPRAIAAQVSPVVVSIAQRPAGDHRLTMTVHPDDLGPVTVRAHITSRGEVQVELLGGTDAGRDALRSIVSDLRRDLAAVMPHATLSLGAAAGHDAADRGAQSGTGGGPGEQQSPRREPGPDPRHPHASERMAARAIPTPLALAGGAGLDTFA